MSFSPGESCTSSPVMEFVSVSSWVGQTNRDFLCQHGKLQVARGPVVAAHLTVPGVCGTAGSAGSVRLDPNNRPCSSAISCMS